MDNDSKLYNYTSLIHAGIWVGLVVGKATGVIIGRGGLTKSCFLLYNPPHITV
jgi:hypothetical protein